VLSWTLKKNRCVRKDHRVAPFTGHVKAEPGNHTGLLIPQLLVKAHRRLAVPRVQHRGELLANLLDRARGC